MEKLIQYLTEKRLLVLLLIVLMVVIGVSSLMNLNRTSYPTVSLDTVIITTVYPGGSPDEIEQLVSIPIEKSIHEVSGIDKVRSYSIENASVVAVYLEENLPNREEVVTDIKDAVDSTDDLPDDAQSPVVEEVNTDKTEVVKFAVQGKTDDVDYAKLREVGKELEDFLYEFDGVAEVTSKGFRDKEFLVEVDPKALTENHIGIGSVSNTLAYRNMDIPGGPLRIKNDEMILRTKGQYENIDEIKNTVIMANDQGYDTKIKDVARVTETFEEPDIYTRLNGKMTITYSVLKQNSQDEVSLADDIKAHIDDFQNPYKNEVEIILYEDASVFTNNNINTVVTNAIVGFFLLAFVLLVFLGPRMSSIVTLTIPLVFTVAFIGMNLAGVSLNVISLFGMIMVLGMIVDFGIVIAENAHRYFEMGMERKEAVSKGISELALPVTVTFICISAAFFPLLILTGLMGKFIKFIPMVIIICLSASWFVALFFMPTILNTFLPAHHKKAAAKKAAKKKKTSELDDGEHLEKGITGVLQRGYMKILAKAIKFRYITVAIIFVVLLGSLFLIPVVGFVFSSGGGEDSITISTKLPVQRNLEYNLQLARKIEKLLMSIPEDELDYVYSSVGETEKSLLDPQPGDGTNKATFVVQLVPEKDRKRVASEVYDEIREKLSAAQQKGVLPKEMIIKAEIDAMGVSSGKPVNVEIQGDDYDVIRKIANEYESYLKTVDGVYDISDDLEEGKEELRYKIHDEIAARTGISVASIGSVLNSAYSGSVATNVKIGEEDIDVRVRFKDELRNQRDSIDDVMISNSRGALIPLNSVTYQTHQPGYSAINRLNYKRLVQVQAQLDTNVTTALTVNNALAQEFADIEDKYPGYEIAYGGENEDTAKSMGQLGSLFLVALLVIYIVLAVFFNSTMIPVVIMSAIPFAMVGIVFALLTHRQPMTFMSMLALFSLAGIIVSNTITLIEFINTKRSENLDIKSAIVEAGVLRLRPVILTTLTTVLGLIPTIYGWGDKNYMVAPLALSFGYGLIFATIITLVLVPCFYHIAEDLKQFNSRLLAKIGITLKGELY